MTPSDHTHKLRLFSDRLAAAIWPRSQSYDQTSNLGYNLSYNLGINPSKATLLSCAVFMVLPLTGCIQNDKDTISLTAQNSYAQTASHGAAHYQSQNSARINWHNGEILPLPAMQRYGFNGHDLGSYDHEKRDLAQFPISQSELELGTGLDDDQQAAVEESAIKPAIVETTKPEPAKIAPVKLKPVKFASSTIKPFTAQTAQSARIDPSIPSLRGTVSQEDLEISQILAPNLVTTPITGPLYNSGFSPKPIPAQKIAPNTNIIERQINETQPEPVKKNSNQDRVFQDTALTPRAIGPAPQIPETQISAPQISAPPGSSHSGPNFTKSSPVKSKPVKSAAIRPQPINTPSKTKLSVPELPADQKAVIAKELAALDGISQKSVAIGSGSLRQSLDKAFKRSSRLAAENLRVDEAKEVLKQAKAQSRPRLAAQGSVGPRSSETTFAFNNSVTSATTLRRSAELDLSLPIYQGGRLRAQRASAELGIKSAKANITQTESEIIEQTALAYLDIVRDRNLTALYQKNVALLEAQQDNTAALLALNEVTISDKALIDARLAAQRIRLETGLGALGQSESRYKNLVGAPAPDILPVPRFDLPLSLVETQALAQQNNPHLTALIHQAKSAEFDVKIAKSSNKPSLALQGVVRGAEGQSETIDRNLAAELLLNVNVPIYSGGEGQSRVRQAKIIRNRLNLEIRETQDRLRDDIENLWAQKTAAEKGLVFNQNQISAARRAVDTVSEQRAEGVATILDLLDVQQSFLDAQIQAISAQSRADRANIMLLNHIGAYQQGRS